MMFALCLAALITAASASAAGPVADAGLTAILKAKDQALLDAIAPGERGLWDRTLVPGAIYIDENGTIMDRAAYLKSLVPLPKGATGHLTIVTYDLRRFGDVALVVHRDDEREDFHGLPMHADYIMSETWLRMSGEWRLAMVHVYVVAVDPPAITLPAGTLEAFVGTYKAGNDLVYVIQRKGDSLIGGRSGSPMKPLLAETSDVFFTPGQPRVKRLFHRDADGRVTGFTDRREGEDIHWSKISGR